jgi:hypothetical protein
MEINEIRVLRSMRQEKFAIIAWSRGQYQSHLFSMHVKTRQNHHQNLVRRVLMNPKSFIKYFLPGVTAFIFALASINASAEDRHVKSGSGGRVVGSADECIKSIGGNPRICERDDDGDGVLNANDQTLLPVPLSTASAVC